MDEYDNFDWEEEFGDIGADLDEIMAGIEDGELEDVDMDASAGEFTDMENLLDFVMPGAFSKSGSGQGVSIRTFPDASAPAGSRHFPTPSLHGFLSSKGVVRESGNELLFCPEYATGSKRPPAGSNIVVGIVRSPTHRQIQVDSTEIFQRANRYSEENSGKGTALGFSNFYHSAACLSLATDKGVVEPMSGRDVEFKHISIEVTGQNFKRRQTQADWVINKYALLGVTVEPSLRKDYERLSHAEDSGDTSMFENTAFDQGDSPYSAGVRSVMSSIRTMTDLQHESIAMMFLSWLSRNYKTAEPHVPQPLDVNPLYEYMRKSSKATSVCSGCMFPAPFKALIPQVPYTKDPERDAKRADVRVNVYHFCAGASTYHTLDLEEDLLSKLWVDTGVRHEGWVECATEMAEGYDRFLGSRAVFQYAKIQSELVPKIINKDGSFYSKYSRVGIAWARSHRLQLDWLCCYYVFDQPPDEKLVGRWEKTKTVNGLDLWRSACFRVSRSDVHHASVNAMRFVAMCAAVRPLVEESNFEATVESLAPILALWTDTSWKTSVLAGNSRFITCCHMSNSGDMQALFVKGMYDLMPLRFADFLFVKLCARYIERADRPDARHTPLLGLPARLCALEKDVSQGMQWHIRGKTHATECMAKLVEVYTNELGNRAIEVNWIELQAEHLRTMQTSGMDQREFDVVMGQTPEFESLNVFTMIACGYLARDTMSQLFSSQTQQKFTLWGMLTDHHSLVSFDSPTGPIFKGVRVAEALTEDLNRYASIHGPYDYLVQQMNGPKIVNHFGMHEKDAKGGDRDISIMEIRQRASQYFTESMANVFNMGVANDVMMEARKYEIVVKDALEIMSSKMKVMSSEDRSNFCGAMHPEKMSVCTAITARMSGTTALVSAAGLQMVNRSRHVVFPSGFQAEYSKLPEGCDVVHRMGNSVVEKVPRIKMQNHMMQGIYAGGAGLVNTLFSTGLQIAQANIQRCIRKRMVYTTSDDLVRGISLQPGCDYDAEREAFLRIPNSLLHHAMMKENKSKPIESDNIIEFNNIVVTRAGMVSQAPIHAALTLQPLLGTSFIMDLVTVVSSARQTMFWGDSPDLAQASLYGGCQILRQKWIVKMDEWNLMLSMGLVPRNIGELIEGFFPRNESVLKALWHCLSEEMRQSVLNGEIPLWQSLFSIEGVDVARQPKRVRNFVVNHDLPRYKHVLRGILASRRVSSRMNPKYVQSMAVARRRGAFTTFMSKIMLAVTDDVDMSALMDMRPPRVTPHFMRHRKRDQRPLSMGVSARVDVADLRKIRTWRHCRVHYRSYADEEQVRLASLSDDEFEKWCTREERKSHVSGLSFKSPGGRPLVRIVDNRRYLKPTAFDFDVELPVTVDARLPYTFQGRIVQEFAPVLWGSASLSMAQGTIAFAKGFIDGDLYLFYVDRLGNVAAAKSRYRDASGQTTGLRTATACDGTDVVSAVLGNDYSTITLQHIRTSFIPQVPGLTGDLDAVLNYGGFLKSKQPGAFALWRKLFRNHRSDIPQFMLSHMLNYPNFHVDAVEIPRGHITRFMGSRSIGRLHLVDCDNRAATLIVDLNDRTPMVATPVESEVDFG